MKTSNTDNYYHGATTQGGISPEKQPVDNRNNVSTGSAAAGQKIDNDQMPRPLRMLNQTSAKTCVPDRFLSKGVDIPPSGGIPWI